MKMCKETMKNMGMDEMMQKGKGMAKNCMGAAEDSDKESPKSAMELKEKWFKRH